MSLKACTIKGFNLILPHQNDLKQNNLNKCMQSTDSVKFYKRSCKLIEQTNAIQKASIYYCFKQRGYNEGSWQQTICMWYLFSVYFYLWSPSLLRDWLAYWQKVRFQFSSTKEWTFSLAFFCSSLLKQQTQTNNHRFVYI